MSALVKIFEPIAAAQTSLNEITVVAFDTMGTLVHYTHSIRSGHTYAADPQIARLFRDISGNAEKLGLHEVTIISGDAAEATEALRVSGLQRLHGKPVEDRGAFYARMQREGKNVLVVDDNFMLGMLAEAHVDPQDSHVRQYLGGQLYKDALNFNP